jgi:hypothetical protein
LLRACNAEARTVSADMIEHAARELRLAAGVRAARQTVTIPRELAGVSKEIPWDPLEIVAPSAANTLTAHPAAAASQWLPYSPKTAGADTDGFPAPRSDTLGTESPNEMSAPPARPAFTWPAFRGWRFPGVAAPSAPLYGVAAALAVAVPVITLINGSPVAKVTSSGAQPSFGSVAASASYDAEERYDDRLREAVFISPTSPIHAEPPWINIVASREAEPISDLQTRAPSWHSSREQTNLGQIQNTSLSRNDPPPAGGGEDLRSAPTQKTQQAPHKSVRVLGASLLRKKPRADADIIGTLEAGSRVVVLSRSGDFYHVRSVEKKPLRGYVHREDAFFESMKQRSH